MIGSQFHPEFGSRLDKPPPLFDSFIKACVNQKNWSPIQALVFI